MSGTFENLKVPPTLISFGICATEASRVVSNELKNPGNKLLLLKTTIDNSCTTDFEVQCGILDRLEDLIGENKLLSVCPVGYGGAFMTLVKMAIGNEIGFDVAGLTPAQWAMSDYGSVIVEVNSDFDVAEELGGLEVIELGATTDRDVISVNGELKLSFDELIEEYEATLEPIFPTKLHEEENTKLQKISFFERSEDEPEKKKERPKVIIPTFPGTNCEMDSAQAFRKAGAEAEIFIIRNNNAQELEESIDQLASAIDSADILMIPGGFSGGDEPDGSAKFITAVFRNPKIAKATMRLVDERKGLILGICNGFQALIKLGLVPFGEILSQKDDSPTLTYNEIGRHMSCLVRTRIASVKSPWLAGVEVDDVFTIPVSHGEGKFICDPKLFKQLAANGQIVSQYVDMDREPAMDIRYNPNGSAMAVEAITSPCGRILGKMGHSERIGDNLYKNVIGEKDMRLFESAVRYFKEK